jgi:hypothetical protein
MHKVVAKLIGKSPYIKYEQFNTLGAFTYTYKNRIFQCQILWDRIKIDDDWHYNTHGASGHYVVSMLVEHAMRGVMKEINNNKIIG